MQNALTVNLVGEFALGADIKKYIYKMKGNFLHPYWENGSGWGDGSSEFYLYQDDLELEGEPSSSEEITSGVRVRITNTPSQSTLNIKRMNARTV